MNTGFLNILNVGDGDTTLSFDNKNPEEVERAKKIIGDMLKRGYSILAQVGTRKGEPLYQRVKSFDAKKCEYIIASVDNADIDLSKIEGEKKRGRRSKTQRIPAKSTNAVAVARTAGG